MSVASLSSQFSDVQKKRFFDLATPTPPAPLSIAREVRETRVGQTIWCGVEATNNQPFDAYLVMRPVFRIPAPEYRRNAAELASAIKRLDVIGPPSPFGSSISEMLGEVWRFFVPAGATRSFAFFTPSDGLDFYIAVWATDLAGVLLPIINNFDGFIWTAVGAAHALMVGQERAR